jgi:predicted PurR-regulated permease PerM
MEPIPKSPISSIIEKKIPSLEILQYVFLVTALLYFGRTLFIPLSFAMLVSFILYPVCKWMEQKGISPMVAIGISLISVALLFSALFLLLFYQVLEFTNEWQSLDIKLKESLNELSLFLTNQFGINEEKQLNYIKNTLNNSSSQVLLFLKNAIYSFSESLFYLLIVPIFSALILYYRQLLVYALYHFFPENKKEMIHEIIVGTIQEYYKFIKGMIVVYILVGILNSIGLAVIGIPYPILFGFTASLLTFIPYVGIMVSSLLPITVAWITFYCFCCSTSIGSLHHISLCSWKPFEDKHPRNLGYDYCWRHTLGSSWNDFIHSFYLYCKINSRPNRKSKIFIVVIE